MNYYETLYIIHPALEAGRLKDIIIDVEDNLKKIGGDPLAIELWGKRKLAYFIDKQKYGTYVLVQYNGEGKCTREFAVLLEHNPNILAYLTTNINQDDVIEQEETLETQIDGKSRELEKFESRVLKSDGDKKITTLDSKKQEGGSVEVNEKESSNGGGRQTGSKMAEIKDNAHEEVLSKEDEKQIEPKTENVNLPIEGGEDEPLDVVAKPEEMDESKSTKENTAEETESNKKKANKSAAKNEKE